MFILCEKTYWGNEYYKGKTFIIQGECYPSASNNNEEAKQYTSKATADNACKKLNNKVGRCFEVIELK
jgi:hypothetical protein